VVIVAGYAEPQGTTYGLEAHTQIANAIQEHDGARAFQAMMDHLLDSEQRLTKVSEYIAGRRWNQKVNYSQHPVIQEFQTIYHFRRIAMNRKILALLGVLVLASLLIGACQPAAPKRPPETEAPVQTAAPPVKRNPFAWCKSTAAIPSTWEKRPALKKPPGAMVLS